MAITYLSGNRIQGLSTDTLETVTFHHTNSTGWIETGTQHFANTLIQAVGVNTNTDNRVRYDLGSAQSDSQWVLTGQLKIHSVNVYNYFGYISLTASSSRPYQYASQSDINNDSLGILFHRQDNEYRIHIVYKDGTGNLTLTASYLNLNAASTPYQLVLTRTSATQATLKAYSDVEKTTQVGATVIATIPSTVTSLRYIQSGTISGSYSGVNDVPAGIGVYWEFQGLKFYNGVTSVNSKPVNVPANSRFEETDTRKIYYSDGSIAVSPDALGSTADGTQYNGVTQTSTGKLGSNAYLYNGSNSYTTLGSSLSQWNFMHNQSALCTVALWFKLTNASSSNESLFDNHNVDPTKIGCRFGLRQNRTCSFSVSSGSVVIDYQSSDNFIPNDTNWHFLVYLWDYSLGSANLKVRLDDSTEETANKTGTASNSNATHAPNIGKRALANDFYLDASLDEFSIWNRILTSAEITTLYNSGVGRTVPDAISAGVSNVGLKAYYNFEQTSGNLTNKAKSTAWSQET